MSYKLLTKHGHPNAKANGQILEHVFIMSGLLERALTNLEVVHHRDEDKRNNHPSNLQLFATSAEHEKHHAEQRALIACGNASFMKCRFCKTYDDPLVMVLRKTQHGAYHNKCYKEYMNTPERKAAHNASSAKSRALRRESESSQVVA